MNNSVIKKRAEIPTEYKWATEDLYASDMVWEQALTEILAYKELFMSFEGHLADSANTLLDYLLKMESANSELELLATYCMRKADEDTTNPTYQAMVGKFMSAAVALETACSFETPELMAIDEGSLNTMYIDCPELEHFRRYLTDARRRKEHILSGNEEKILAAAGEMAQTPNTAFEAFTDADMKYPDAIDSLGQHHKLSHATFVRLEQSTDRELRKSAYENLYQTIRSFENTAAALLNGQNKQLKFFAETRHYTNAFESSLDRTNVPTEVYLNLIDAVHKNFDKMHRYVRLRKKLLGVEQLHFYDIYAPLLKESSDDIPFDCAKEMVYDALAPLGDEYRRILREGFNNRWIDVYPSEGKRGGAYSAGAAIHPFVMLNYTGALNDVFTLAHEMGHALHSFLSEKHQAPIDANYVIFVAEVASTCNEALLMQHLLKKADNKQEKAHLINHFLEQFKGTLYRQTMFAEFELLIGQKIAAGDTLTAEYMNAEYKRLNEEYFGPDIVSDDNIALEWARIPHFYYNYYVFQYATGYSAAIALSRRILQEGETAVKDYLNFLSGGCSKSPIELLKGAGVDMTSPEPVNSALQMFEELLDEMEKLLQE